MYSFSTRVWPELDVPHRTEGRLVFWDSEQVIADVIRYGFEGLVYI